MNKSIFALLICIPMFGIEPEKASDKVMKFLNMEHNHKLDWLHHKKAQVDAKIDMLIKHKDQLFALKEDYMKKLASNRDIQPIMAEMLDAAIALHEKQNKEWKNLCESGHTKAADIALKHEEELNAYKDYLHPEKKEAKKAEKPEHMHEVMEK